ncbi:MAG: hypothetical protein J5927_07670, partial [Oscillospiraceae bacterium]|nr:hypothetical protein [Oscillospiraceae bacterium]
IVFLLVAAVIITVLTGFDRTRESGTPDTPQETVVARDNNVINENGVLINQQTPAPEAPAAPTARPVAPVATPVATPAANGNNTNADAAATPVVNTEETPAPEEEPAETPEPTPEPTPTPAPTPTPEILDPTYPSVNLGSGTFRSQTGEPIDISAEWTARTVSDTTAEVQVTVYLECFAIHLVPVPRSLDLSLDGKYATLDVGAVDHDGPEQLRTELGHYSFLVNLPKRTTDTFHLDAVWGFGGVYHGQNIPAIECGGDIELIRH